MRDDLVKMPVDREAFADLRELIEEYAGEAWAQGIKIALDAKPIGEVTSVNTRTGEKQRLPVFLFRFADIKIAQQMYRRRERDTELARMNLRRFEEYDMGQHHATEQESIVDAIGGMHLEYEGDFVDPTPSVYWQEN